MIQNDNIVLSTTEDYIGPVLPYIAAQLMEITLERYYIAGTNLYPCLARMNNLMQNKVPGWKMRITGRRRRAIIRDNQTAISGQFFVDYIAIDQKTNNSKKRLPRKRIDILNLELIQNKPPTNPKDQLEMALIVIDLQRKRGIKQIKKTRGSIGAGLLKKSPLWEENRHAAPKFINDYSRMFLPGSYYSISNKVRKKTKFSLPFCYLIDQDNAHHTIATDTFIPHPNHIRARGHYKVALEDKDFYPTWCRPQDNIGKQIIDGEHFGLVLAKISISILPPTTQHLYPPWAQKRGRYYKWLWTPDLRYFQTDQRLQLDSFVAGFTATIRDSAIAEYGKWALDYIKSPRGGKKYTKSTLLAAYGMLAFNQANYRKQYKYWGGQISGSRVLLPEAGTVSEREIKFSEVYQHSIINVIARGIIEAEQRTRTLEYAKELHSQNYHVAQVYADALVIQSDQLPFIRSGWRIAEEMYNVFIPRPNAIVSDQVVRLPGIPYSEDDLRWLKYRDESRKPLTNGREYAKVKDAGNYIPA